MTHLEIASAIRNNVMDALSGSQADQSLSIEQLLDEIDLARSAFANKYAGTKQLDISFMVQEPPLFKLTCDNLSPECSVDGFGESIPFTLIPAILPIFGEDAIQYLGLNNMMQSMLVYYHPEEITNHFKKIRIKNKPFVWVDTAARPDDKHILRFFNMGEFNPLQYIKLRAVFAHPSKVNPNALDSEYPAPQLMQDAIIEKLTINYVRYYRELSVPPLPNQQTDLT